MLNIENEIFSVSSAEDFDNVALRIFGMQYANNTVYRQWCDLLDRQPGKIENAAEIPFLPVEFFKSHPVVSTPVNANTVKFVSSATTGATPSIHYVNNPAVYVKSFTTAFERVYGRPSEYCILALLPHYLERGNSSLVFMVNHLMGLGDQTQGGFFLDAFDQLEEKIAALKRSGQKVMLFGVSYALLDLAEKGVTLGPSFIVMETGGLKGRRKEMTKQALHDQLKMKFQVEAIHGEYGMTELLSQAYNTGDGKFHPPPWMRFYTRDTDDALHLRSDDKTGGVNVMDLANINSCAFIATKDLGRLNADGSVEIMGRYDHSDVRGCNLMIDF
jgi:hypothetical protein